VGKIGELFNLADGLKRAISGFMRAITPFYNAKVYIPPAGFYQ
jgi:hypothetical protein